MSGSIYLGSSSILICLNSLGVFQALLKGCPAIGGIISFYLALCFGDESVEIGLIANFLQAVNGIVELLNHRGLFFVGKFLLFEYWLGAESGSVHSNLLIGPDIFQLFRYFIYRRLEVGIGIAGISGAGDLLCTPQAVLQIFFRIFNFLHAGPIHLHSGVLIAAGRTDGKHHGNKNMNICGIGYIKILRFFGNCQITI